MTSRAPGDALAAVPKAARAHTNAGAQAFAEFYVHQINAAWSEPSAQRLRPLGDGSCKSCQGYVATSEALERDLQRYDRDAARIVFSSWFPESTGNRAVVRIVLDQRRCRIVDHAGTVVSTTAAQRAELEFTLWWSPKQGWRVHEIQQVVGRRS